jgi:hypothetical protein
MKPVRPEIDRVPAQANRHGAAADPVTRLEHRDPQALREQPSRRPDAGRARAEDRDIDLARRLRKAWADERLHGFSDSLGAERVVGAADLDLTSAAERQALFLRCTGFPDRCLAAGADIGKVGARCAEGRALRV